MNCIDDAVQVEDDKMNLLRLHWTQIKIRIKKKKNWFNSSREKYRVKVWLELKSK
jgi:hypothetical protein